MIEIIIFLLSVFVCAFVGGFAGEVFAIRFSEKGKKDGEKRIP